MNFDPISFAMGMNAAKGSGGSSNKTILAEQTFEGFATNAAYDGAYVFELEKAPVLAAGETYIVQWDGTEYTCTAQDFSALAPGMVAIGNLTNFGGSGNDEPFIINYNASSGGGGILSFDTETSHTVGIYQKVEAPSYEDVHFITFMSEDGTQELYKRPVADSDDCADPVERGYISEPTKESTAQYNYTHVGWSASPNGALDENILKAVTADKTVYANFAAVVRYYTINFYDGETLLSSKSVAYGTIPTIANPTKDGYSFDSWNPSIVAVTGDADYYAQWVEKVTFAAGSWADIARICEAGEAAKYFAIGDTRNITCNERTYEVKIAAFNQDNLADGSGTAGITCVSSSNYGYTKAFNSTSGTITWETSSLRTYCNNTIYNGMEDELKAIIKQVTKNTFDSEENGFFSTADYCWALEGHEIGGYLWGGGPTKYPLFPSLTSANIGADYWLRDTKSNNQMAYYLNGDLLKTATVTGAKGLRFGFCI